jgi:hypothetical protein
MTTRMQRMNALIKSTPTQRKEIDDLLKQNKMAAYNRLVLKILADAKVKDHIAWKQTLEQQKREGYFK